MAELANFFYLKNWFKNLFNHFKIIMRALILMIIKEENSKQKYINILLILFNVNREKPKSYINWKEWHTCI
jgi:hypothetical protein